jgi:hypothetical protein
MLHIEFTNGEHVIDWLATPEQEELARLYRQPLKRALAEEQAAKYRRDPDKHRSLGYVADLLDQDVYEPYLGAIGGGDRYIIHDICKGTGQYAVQYQYRDSKPIWLTEPLSISADGIYRVTPTGLGYVVKYEVDISDYDNW